MDGVIPRSRLPEVLDTVGALDRHELTRADVEFGFFAGQRVEPPRFGRDHERRLDDMVVGHATPHALGETRMQLASGQFASLESLGFGPDMITGEPGLAHSILVGE